MPRRNATQERADAQAEAERVAQLAEFNADGSPQSLGTDQDEAQAEDTPAGEPDGDKPLQAGIQIGGELGAEDTPAAPVVNKALIPVPVDMLGDVEDVPEEEWTTAPLAVADERDPAQVKLDEDVKSAHEAWVKAGKPLVSQSPRKRRAVSPEHGPAVRRMLGQAAKLHGVRVVISPVAHDKDGREIIVFSARDKEVRTRTPSAETQAIREWANAHDAVVAVGERFRVGDRGRIPENVRAAYDAAMAEKAEADSILPVGEDDERDSDPFGEGLRNDED